MKTADFVDCLDTEFVERLQKSWGDLKTILKESIEQVAPREQYVVLVAGKILKRFLCLERRLKLRTGKDLKHDILCKYSSVAYI